MLKDDDDVPPLDPKRVALFGAFLALIVLGGWYFWRARSAVKAVAEASKDYRRLFPARTEATTAPAPGPMPTGARPVSGIRLLKIDDDMRPAKRVAAPPPQQEEAATPPVAAVKAEAVAPAAPVKKDFAQPRLNSGAFSGLNGGAGVSFSGGSSGAAAPPPAADGK